MKKISSILILGLAVLWCNIGFAQNQLKSNNTIIKFFSETPVENIDAICKEAVSILSIPKNQMAFSVPIKCFKFKNALMEEHFNEKYMESHQYPNATFAGTITDQIDFKNDGDYKFNVSGKLKIHGVEREINLPATAIVKQGKISLNADIMVKLVDYKIEVPTLVFNKIAEEIKVSIQSTYNNK
ncbi:MAG: YceI family protein [Cytophagales bacterium]|nr:MAG: YceI family protein [Cytophagales bacterium]